MQNFGIYLPQVGQGPDPLEMFVFQRPTNVAVFNEQTLTDRSEKLVEDAAFLT